MSLRNSLKTAVACCTPLQMQHATFEENHATGYATPLQLGSATDATQANSGEKLHVAFVSTCNTQPGPLTAHRLTADLLKAAMRVCDKYGDSKAAREAMRRECLELSPHLQADLLIHFRKDTP